MIERDVEALNCALAKQHQRYVQMMILDRSYPLPFQAVSVASLTISTLIYWLSELDYPERTGVLIYDHDDRETLKAWLVDSSGLMSALSNKISQNELLELAADLRRALEVTPLQAARAPRYRHLSPLVSRPADTQSLEKVLCRLSSVLMSESLAQTLYGLTNLIVVPMSWFGTIPFGLLTIIPSDELLIERMPITVASSIQELGRKWPTHSLTSRFRSPLIVGNPALSGTKEWSFPRLPGAEREARWVAQMHSVIPLTGMTATKRAVLQRVDPRLASGEQQMPDLLYFATHGVTDPDDPLDGSFLALSEEGGALGKWTAREIQRSFLTARLAVLSACQTGLGKTHDAGIIGLARAFLIAGTERVVMSLWSVNDEATFDLMKLFMQHLESNSASEALRRAMLSLRTTRPNPSEWASFAVFGLPG